MKTSCLLSICQRLFESLDRAAAEGYDNILLNPADETADEIGEYDAQLADVPKAVLRPLAAAWLAARNHDNAPKPSGIVQQSGSTNGPYYHARTGAPVSTLEAEIHSVLDLMLQAGPICSTPTSILYAVKLRSSALNPIQQAMRDAELLPHIESWFKKYDHQ